MKFIHRALAIFFYALILIFLPISQANDLAHESNVIYAVPGEAIEDDILLSLESPEVFITYHGDTNNWDLDPLKSPILNRATLLVQSDSPWRIYVSSKTDGYMSEFDIVKGFVPDGRRLGVPLNVSAENGKEVDLSEGGLLIDGIGDETINLTLRQPVSWSDEPLPQGHDYRALISFIPYS